MKYIPKNTNHGSVVKEKFPVMFYNVKSVQLKNSGYEISLLQKNQ